VLADGTAPFIWEKVGTTALPGVMVSVFPKTAAITSSSKEITIKAKQLALASVDMWKAPSQPTAASAITEGSTHLVASGVAALAVLSTLI